MSRTWTLLLIGTALSQGACNPCNKSGNVCTVVGDGQAGSNNEDKAHLAQLYGPMDVAVYKDPDSYFIADWNNHKIRLVEGGRIRTAIGTDFLGDGDPSFQERIPPGIKGTKVALNHPTSMEWNPVTGKLLVPSWHNHRVREWTPRTGNSLVVCANTDISDGNGANAGFEGDGGPAADALMAFPNSIAIDPDDGSFWLLAQKNGRIRWVARDYSLIDTVAGTGEVGHDGDGDDARDATFDFWDPEDLQPEPAGAVEYHEEKLYIADTSNHAIRVIDLLENTIDTLPGTGEQTLPGGQCDPDALCFPRDVEIGPRGKLWIADEANHVIRSYDLDSHTMKTEVGTFEPGAGGEGVPGKQAKLDRPYGIDLAKDGTLYIADTYNHRIRRMIP